MRFLICHLSVIHVPREKNTKLDIKSNCYMTYVIKITPEMKRQFRSETTEHLNSLEQLLMVIEKEPRNQEAIHSAFRDIHSIKGNSDYLGIKDINILSHELEDLMDEFRSGRIHIGDDVLAVLFNGLDLLRDMNRRVVNEDYEETDISEIQTRIHRIKTLFGKESPGKKAEVSYSDIFYSVLEQEIKVDINKIDQFINHISELVITKNTLNFLTELDFFREQHTKRSGELKKVAGDMSRITNNLQADVMSLRLVKINTVFERLPRIVRDISYRSGKQIELSLSGGETEIDRKTIEQLIDPLIHLIRNSVDHGIEPPNERVRKGKPESGVVTVSSRQEGNHAVIEVMDDGKGLDIDKIRQEALKRKIFTEDTLVSMREEEILNLIFLPGFTTQPEATKTSGRGVGLDVVKNNIKMIGGNITLSGSKDIGTRVKVRIPVSMAVTDVLLTEVAGRQYAFPFSSILKTVKVKKKIFMASKKANLFFSAELFSVSDASENY